MLARVSKIPVLVFVLVVVAGVAAAFTLSTGGDAQTAVEVRRGDAPARVSALNRADDYGADVVRTYLQAALACTPAGARVMTELSRPREGAARKLFGDACAASGGRPLAERLEAELAREELDARGRSLWRVETSAGTLPRDLLLRVRQGQSGWEIERACGGACPP